MQKKYKKVVRRGVEQVITVNYTVTDGQQASDQESFVITLTGTNDIPIADADDYTLAVDTQLITNQANGVLFNDNDIDGDGLNAVLNVDVSNGTLTLNADGSFEYTPDPGFTGQDSFTYFANDGTIDSVATTVTLTIE